VSHLAPFRGDFLPSFYNYPSLYLILSRVAIDLAAGYHLLRPEPPLHAAMAQWVGDFARLLLVGRLVAVALAVGTVLLVYAIARRLYGRRPAWLAAIFLSVAPLHAVHAHYMAVDVPAAFFAALCLYACARALPVDGRAARSFGARRWVAIGAIAGLAAGTKYNAGLVLVAGLVPLTAWARAWRVAGVRHVPARWAAGASLMGAAALLAFLLTTPGALLESGPFLNHLAYELWHSEHGHGEVFRELPPAGLYHLAVTLPLGLGWPLFALAMGGVGLAFWRRRPADWLLLAATLPYYLLMAGTELRFLRYMLPLLPPLAILAARFTVAAGAVARRHLTRGGARGLGWTLGGLAAAVALAVSVAHLRVMASEDPRDAAARWLRQTTLPGETVALANNSWFYTPPLDPSAGCITFALRFGGPPVWDVDARNESRPPAPFDLGSLRVLAPRAWPAPQGPLPVPSLEQYRPERVVISDYEYADPLRIGRADPEYARRNPELALWQALHRSYVLEKEFRPRPRLGGLTWFANETPPHDWAYYMPTIQVYRRKR
jgi:4-amino-4-deoxy-L-arabinose transferase-like glycosyltransferase